MADPVLCRRCGLALVPEVDDPFSVGHVRHRACRPIRVTIERGPSKYQRLADAVYYARERLKEAQLRKDRAMDRGVPFAELVPYFEAIAKAEAELKAAIEAFEEYRKSIGGTRE